MLKEFLEIKNKVFRAMHEDNEKNKDLKVLLKSLHVKYFQGFKL